MGIVAYIAFDFENEKCIFWKLEKFQRLFSPFGQSKIRKYKSPLNPLRHTPDFTFPEEGNPDSPLPWVKGELERDFSSHPLPEKKED